ncbi:M23 family metallopeptidase [uncultured Endozoicomonas sp.]|uniref:M23 family metallopeptidase n=1 Tax=uncultured Endozoicomonas sp. TaxID=432652 RepID=UPI00262C9FFF|nr:M23 family metallopeptidase [uncultured Endozoicomonas sp.]
MRLFCSVLLVLLSGLAVAKGLESRLTPGGLYVGKAPVGARVFYDNKEVSVAPDGRFIIGFGRDAELKQSYTLQFINGGQATVELNLKAREYDVQSLTGIAKKYVSPDERVLNRIRQEAEAVRYARMEDTQQSDLFNGFGWPVKGRISGVYGSQRVYNGKPGRPHYGLDIAVPTGTPVKAPADGIVRLADSDLYYSGGTIIIDHGYGIFSSFLHLSKVTVNEGSQIKRGQLIGEVGATGRVTGPHLDWRYNWFDKRLDPALLTLGE